MKRMNEFRNKKIETLSPDELRTLQEEKLRKQIQYVYEKSTFYQEKFKKAGLVPGDIRSAQDLKKIPFTTKEELKESQSQHPPLGFHMAVPMDKIIRIHSSSGTTGHPSFVGITKHDHRTWTEITARSIYTQGIRPKDIVIHAVGLTFFVGGLPVKDAIEAIGAAFVPIGTGASDRMVTTTQLLQANTLHCTPSYAIYLADYIRSTLDRDPSSLGIKKITSGAEPGAGIPSIRKKFKTILGAALRKASGMRMQPRSSSGSVPIRLECTSARRSLSSVS